MIITGFLSDLCFQICFFSVQTPFCKKKKKKKSAVCYNNRPNSQIPCTSPISHSAPFRTQNAHILCSEWCTVGYGTGAFCDLWDWYIPWCLSVSLFPVTDLIVVTSYYIKCEWNRHQLDRLFNSWFRPTTKISSKHYCPFLRGIHQSPVDSSHKVTVMQKEFPCHDVTKTPYYWPHFEGNPLRTDGFYLRGFVIQKTFPCYHILPPYIPWYWWRPRKSKWEFPCSSEPAEMTPKTARNTQRRSILNTCQEGEKTYEQSIWDESQEKQTLVLIKSYQTLLKLHMLLIDI